MRPFFFSQGGAWTSPHSRADLLAVFPPSTFLWAVLRLKRPYTFHYIKCGFIKSLRELPALFACLLCLVSPHVSDEPGSSTIHSQRSLPTLGAAVSAFTGEPEQPSGWEQQERGFAGRAGWAGPEEA